MSSGKVLLGVLVGIAAGATLGILFAPDKGSSTRKKIKQKSDDYAEELEEKFNEFIESLTDRFEAVKEEVLKRSENGFLKADEVEEKIEEIAHKKHK